jgi:hypothetical protein
MNPSIKGSGSIDLRNSLSFVQDLQLKSGRLSIGGVVMYRRTESMSIGSTSSDSVEIPSSSSSTCDGVLGSLFSPSIVSNGRPGGKLILGCPLATTSDSGSLATTGFDSW